MREVSHFLSELKHESQSRDVSDASPSVTKDEQLSGAGSNPALGHGPASLDPLQSASPEDRASCNERSFRSLSYLSRVLHLE